MADKKINVTPADLKSASTRVAEQAQVYHDAYDQLYQKADELVSASYTGVDASAFREQIEGFRPDLRAMEDLMRDYGDFLQKAAATYEETQNAMAQAAKRLTN